MLTMQMHIVAENFAKELVGLIKSAIKNKPIKRVSRRKVKGKYVDKTFYAPVNASGALHDTIRYELNETSLSIWANDYIYDLVWGKPPSKSATANDINLESKIKTWMNFKGISSVDTNESTLAYYITRKIQKFGSSIYLANHGKNSGLLENIVSKPLIDSYNAKFAKEIQKEFKNIFI